MSNAGFIPRSSFTRYRIIFTITVTVLILGLLLWQHFHGGVPAHHILQKKELPEISNWWGALLLPLLTWFLTRRIEKRIYKNETGTGNYKSEIFTVLKLLFTGLAFGLLLAISFTHDFKPFLDNVLYFLLALSLIIPIYYSEFILGFVLGMTYTFGSLLPTAFVLVMAAIGFLIFKFIRPLFIKLIRLGKK